jgi:hypothetical protein
MRARAGVSTPNKRLGPESQTRSPRNSVEADGLAIPRLREKEEALLRCSTISLPVAFSSQWTIAPGPRNA